VKSEETTSKYISVVLFFCLVASFIGHHLGSTHSTGLVQPEPITSPFRVSSQMLEPSKQEFKLERGAHIAGGAMQITQHVFYDSDRVILQPPPAISRADITLAEDSDTLLVIMGATTPHFSHLRPDSAKLNRPDSDWITTSGGEISLYEQNGRLRFKDAAQDLDIGPFLPGKIELKTEGTCSRINKISLWDAEGSNIYRSDFEDRGKAPLGGALGAFLAFFTVAAGAYVLRRGRTPLLLLRTSLLCLIPAATAMVHPSAWMRVLEKAYVVDIFGWELATACFSLSFVPLVWAAVNSSGLFSLVTRPRRGSRLFDRRATQIWYASALICTFAGGRDASGLELLWGIPIAIVVFFHPRTMHLGQFRNGHWLIWDFLSLALIGLLGWKALPLALLWRLMLVTSSLPVLLSWAPKPSADYLFAMLLAIPISLELSIRSSSLSQTWDSAALGLQDTTDYGVDDASSTWSGECGYSDSPPLRIAYAGGSSAGGAYQFQGDNGAFFPSQTHNLLCSHFDSHRDIISTNFAAAARNSHTISRAIDEMLRQASPDLFIVYSGVNDLFDKRYTKSRKVREEERAARQLGTRTVIGFARKSRLLSGAGLLFQQRSTKELKVSEVSLQEAEENFRSMVKDSLNTSFVLLTELVATPQKQALKPYQQMQARIASEYSHVHSIDLREHFSDSQVDTMLLDVNHMTKEGNGQLATVLKEYFLNLLPGE
jgi:hypothetical protein